MADLLYFLKHALLRSPEKMAGLAFILVTFLIAASWSMVIFLDPIPNLSIADSAARTLQELFSQTNPSRLWFVWFAVLPVICTLLGAAYLSGLAQSQAGAMILFVLSVALAATAFLFTHWSLALCVALPCYWGFRCAYRTRELRN